MTLSKQFAVGFIVGIMITLVSSILYFYFSEKSKSDNGFSTQVNKSLDPIDLPSDTVGMYSYLWDWQVNDLRGGSVKLATFKGKAIYLHFWATWCPPCVVELPEIQQLYDSLQRENIAFLMVSNERESKIEQFIRQHQYTFPVYYTREDVPEAFSFIGIPSTFVLDRAGTIRIKQTGAAKWNQPKTIRFLRKIM